MTLKAITYEETKAQLNENKKNEERLPLTKFALNRLRVGTAEAPAIIHINHLLGDVVEFNRLLEQSFSEVHFIPLDYTKTDRIEADELRRIHRNLSAEKKDYIVIEDGGYWTSMMTEAQIAYAPLAHVEQTTRGARLAAHAISSSQLHHPVYSIARSLPKVRIENFFVANRIVIETEILLSKIGQTCIFKNCIVFGYGIIGRAVAKALRSLGCNVYVHDVDEAIMNSALSEGFNDVSLMDAAKFKGLFVFGATGNDISESPLFLNIADVCPKVFLISCSSGEIEFCTWRARFINHRENLEQIGEHYKASGNSVTILGNGRPINFFRSDAESLPDCVADLVNATLVSAVTIAMKSPNTVPNLRLLDVNVFEKRGWDGLSLVERWASIHGFFEKGIASETGTEHSVHPLEAKLAKI